MSDSPLRLPSVARVCRYSQQWQHDFNPQLRDAAAMVGPVFWIPGWTDVKREDACTCERMRLEHLRMQGTTRRETPDGDEMMMTLMTKEPRRRGSVHSLVSFIVCSVPHSMVR